MTRLDTLLALAAIIGVTGCALPFGADAETARNQCSDAEPCGPGATCVAGSCVTVSADLGALYLQIDLPATSSFGPGTSHVIDLQGEIQGQKPGGFYRQLNVGAGSIVAVEASLELGGWADGCAAFTDFVNDKDKAKGGFLPVSLQLYPAAQAAGLPLTAYSASSEVSVEENALVVDSAAAIVPAGRYDVYLKPKPELAAGDKPTDETKEKLAACQVPPLLLKGMQVDDEHADFHQVRPDEPSRLTGTFDIDAESDALAGWVVDLVDNSRGRVISTSATLAAGSTFELRYWPEQVEVDSSQVIVRLTPPETQKQLGLPLMTWSLPGVDLDGDRDIQLTVKSLLEAKSIDVTGSVLAATNNAPVRATVYIRSDDLDGFEGFHVFQTTVESDAQGDFKVTLRPGKYELVVLPAGDPSLAVSVNHWTLPKNDLGEGKTVTVFAKSHVSASVTTPSGEPAAGLPVLLQPAGSDSQTYLQQLLEFDQLDAPSASTITDGYGSFQLDVDPGHFDLSVRPPAATALPWLVRQRLDVLASDTAESTPLGQLRIPYPAVLFGSVLAPDQSPLPFAQVRAWLARPSEDAEGGLPAALLLGEASADEAGRYYLLLPASVSQ